MNNSNRNTQPIPNNVDRPDTETKSNDKMGATRTTDHYREGDDIHETDQKTHPPGVGAGSQFDNNEQAAR
jgi:hypothetical protein